MFIRCRSLNPYYTGIHLHLKANLTKDHLKSLNPYYTGIHLHNKIQGEINHFEIVLILIILEYIYIIL